MRRHAHRPAWLLCIALLAASVVNAQDNTEARLREALRQTAAKLHETEADLAQQQLATAAAERERDALKQAPPRAAKADVGQAAALQRRLAQTAGQLAQAQADGQKSQAAQQASAQAAQKAEAARAALAEQLSQLRTRFERCGANDDAVYGTGLEIAAMYRDPEFVKRLSHPSPVAARLRPGARGEPRARAGGPFRRSARRGASLPHRRHTGEARATCAPLHSRAERRRRHVPARRAVNVRVAPLLACALDRARAIGTLRSRNRTVAAAGCRTDAVRGSAHRPGHRRPPRLHQPRVARRSRQDRTDDRGRCHVRHVAQQARPTDAGRSKAAIGQLLRPLAGSAASTANIRTGARADTLTSSLCHFALVPS